MSVPPTFVIAAALLAVVIVRQFAPLIASVLGLAVTAVIGLWGVWLYGQGAGIAFLGVALPQAGFLIFVLVLAAFESLNLWLALKRRKGPAGEGLDRPTTEL